MKTKTNTFVKSSVAVVGMVGAVVSGQASSDYGPAIWRQACSGHWYTSGVGKQFYVEHDMEGYYASTISYLQGCNNSVSIHYCVNGKQDASSDMPAGEITQMVSDAYYAWHVGCWNTHCMGTEHEGFVSNPAWFTDAMYQSSAALTRAKADKYGFAKDRNHIVGHNEHLNSAWRTYAASAFGIDPSCNSHTDPGQYWDWNKFMSLVISSTSGPNPSVVANSDGRQEIFGINSGSGTDHAWQTTANAGWSGWGAIGGASSKIVAAKNADGHLEVFAIGGGNAVYHSWGTTWGGYSSLGGSMLDIDVGMNPDGRLELFGAGTDGKLYHNYQLVANGPTGWSGWFAIGGSGMNHVMVAKNADGHLEAFCIGFHTLYHSWNGPSGWVAPASLGGSVVDWTDFSSVLWNDGRLEVFVAGTGGDLQHIFQLAPNGPTGWSAWSSLGGGGISLVKAGKNANGTPEVFVLAGNTPYHTYWTGNAWSGFASFGGSVRSLALGTNLDGRLEIFGVGLDGAMYHNYQLVANGGTGWSGWFGMGGSFK